MDEENIKRFFLDHRDELMDITFRYPYKGHKDRDPETDIVFYTTITILGIGQEAVRYKHSHTSKYRFDGTGFYRYEHMAEDFRAGSYGMINWFKNINEKASNPLRIQID